MSAVQLKQFIGDSRRVDFVGPQELASDLRPEPPLVYINGGLRHLEKLTSGFSLGDGDSSKHPPQWKLSIEKNQSDLAVGLSNLPAHVNLVRLFGFSGGRSDHAMINCFECLQFCLNRQQTSVEFVDSKIKALSEGDWHISHKGLFSLIAVDEAPLTLSGKVKFKLTNQTLKPYSSHGLSNESNGDLRLLTSSPILFIPATEGI